jgi:hypothetical protein
MQWHKALRARAEGRIKKSRSDQVKDCNDLPEV